MFKEKFGNTQEPLQSHTATKRTLTLHEGAVRSEVIRSENGFNLENALENVPGPIVEFGGPTPEGFKQINTSHFQDRFFTSNLYPGLPRFDPYKKNPPHDLRCPS